MSQNTELSVKLYEDQVGVLRHIGNDRTIFELLDSYLHNAKRPTLGLYFKNKISDAKFRSRTYQTRLMPFFSNLLPEGHLRKYLAHRVSVNSEREFFLLAALGSDLSGAITVEPNNHIQSFTGEINQNLVREHSRIGEELRFSLAGVQLKFSAVQESRGGLTIPAYGKNGSWIVKLPSETYEGVPENEFSMMTLAKLVGIDVPKFNLIDTKSVSNLPNDITISTGRSLSVKRFDRMENNEKVHVEDFAQIFGFYPNQKYYYASFRNILSVLVSEGTQDDVKEFIRRLTFNMLIGNADMHIKNWSVIYYDKINPSLSPAYDFLSTIPYIRTDDTNIRISRFNKFSKVTINEFIHLAQKTSVSKKVVTEIVQETIELFAQEWKREAKNLPMLAEVREAVDIHLETIPIFKGR